MSITTVCRWKEPILGYVPKNDGKKNSRGKGLIKQGCIWSATADVARDLHLPLQKFWTAQNIARVD